MIAGIAKLSRKMAGAFAWVSIIAITLIMAVTWVDVLGAKLFNYPVPGLTEVVTSLHLMLIASAVALAELKGFQVRVEFFVQKLPRRVQVVLTAFAAAVTTIFFIVLGWHAYAFGVSLIRSAETTGTILIPLWPLAFWLVVCSVPASLVFLGELLLSVSGGTKE
jgi:TRAP-type C4-dicarboxylate transport system permease small subunit